MIRSYMCTGSGLQTKALPSLDLVRQITKEIWQMSPEIKWEMWAPRGGKGELQIVGTKDQEGWRMPGNDSLSRVNKRWLSLKARLSRNNLLLEHAWSQKSSRSHHRLYISPTCYMDWSQTLVRKKKREQQSVVNLEISFECYGLDMFVLLRFIHWKFGSQCSTLERYTFKRWGLAGGDCFMSAFLVKAVMLVSQTGFSLSEVG
jgi:hypothetical protein